MVHRQVVQGPISGASGSMPLVQVSFFLCVRVLGRPAAAALCAALVQNRTEYNSTATATGQKRQHTFNSCALRNCQCVCRLLLVKSVYVPLLTVLRTATAGLSVRVHCYECQTYWVSFEAKPTSCICCCCCQSCVYQPPLFVTGPATYLSGLC